MFRFKFITLLILILYSTSDAQILSCIVQNESASPLAEVHIQEVSIPVIVVSEEEIRRSGRYNLNSNSLTLTRNPGLHTTIPQLWQVRIFFKRLQSNI